MRAEEPRGDQRWQDKAEPGEVVLVPARSGGAFDPLGVRACDMNRANDLRAVMTACGGRWLFVTLTIDRSAWMWPEVAYDACQDQVRKVLIKLGTISFCAMELQTKTGEGWPHWHAVVRLTDQKMTIDEARAVVDRYWRVTTDKIEAAAGGGQPEMIYRTRERIGVPAAQNIQEVESREGIAVYLSKYVTKPWKAVPNWMGESTGRKRKIRLSGGFLDVLTKLHRHSPRCGSRKPPSGRKLRVRTLFERMASSGSQLNMMHVVGDGSTRWIGALNIHVDDLADVARTYTCRSLQLGKVTRCRLAIPLEEARRLRSQQGMFQRSRERRIAEKRDYVRSAWSLMQSGAAEFDDSPDFSSVYEEARPTGGGEGERECREREPGAPLVLSLCGVRPGCEPPDSPDPSAQGGQNAQTQESTPKIWF